MRRISVLLAAAFSALAFAGTGQAGEGPTGDELAFLRESTGWYGRMAGAHTKVARVLADSRVTSAEIRRFRKALSTFSLCALYLPITEPTARLAGAARLESKACRQFKRTANLVVAKKAGEASIQLALASATAKDATDELLEILDA